MPTPQRLNAAVADEALTLSALFDLLLQAWRWVLAFVLVGLLLGSLYALLARPVYDMEAMVQIESTNGGAMGSTMKEMRSLMDSNSEAVTEIELVQSRMVLGRTVRDLGLTTTYEVRRFPIIGRYIARLYSGKTPSAGFGPFGWGGEHIDIARFEVPEAYESKRYIITVGQNNEFELSGPGLSHPVRARVGINYEQATDAGPVSFFVRELSARPKTQVRVMAVSEADAVDEIRSHLKVQEKVKQSNILKLGLSYPDAAAGTELLNQIASNYVRQNVERKSAEAQQTLSFLKDQLPSIKGQLDNSEASYNAYRAKFGAVDVTKEGEILLQESVSVERQLVELQSQRKDLLSKFGPDHPRVHAIDSQIAVLESRRGSVSGRVDNLPKTQQDILRLTRDLKVNTEMYNSVLNDTQQLRVAQAGTVGNVRVIDYAVKSREPARPTWKVSLGLGFFLGAFAGIAFVLLRNWLQRGVKSADLIESKLGLTVLATVPESRLQRGLLDAGAVGNRLLAVRDEQDPAIEGIRSLRTALHFSSLDRKNNCIVLTGPNPTIGKTFLSVNLAALLASQGQRVLVIDADMRRGHMHRYFDGERNNGLSEIIALGKPFEDMVRHSSVPGLDFLSTGVLPPNPSELLLHPRFSQLLQDVSSHYDHILIDSPPVLAVTDAVIIGRQAGVTLLVARFGETLMTELDMARKRLEQANALLGGVVMNRVVRSGGSYNYHYEYYRTIK